MEYAQELMVRFRVSDLDPPKRSKMHTSRRVEERAYTQNCPYGKAIGSRTHLVVEFEPQYEEGIVLRERNMGSKRVWHEVVLSLGL